MAATMIDGTTRLVDNRRDEDGTSYHGVVRYTVQAVVGDQAAALDAVRIALYNALAADSALQAALRQPSGDSANRVYHGEAPTGQTLNYIVVADGSEIESDENTSYNMVGVEDTITLDIWWIPKAPSGTTYPNRHYGVELGYKHVARVLNAKSLVLA